MFALARPPCLVSFSGGRDSSGILALAAMVARRETLPLPIPISMRFPAAPGTEESQWQEAVIRHLGLEDWVKLSFTDELDFIGPVAQPVLRRHGLLFPPMAFIHSLITSRARGGSLLTGFHGDLVLGYWRYERLWQLLRGQAGPGKAAFHQAVAALTPPRLRPRLLASSLAKQVASPRWLTPATKRTFLSRYREERGLEPVRWHERVAWRVSRRDVQLGRRAVALLARETDTRPLHPFSEPPFVSSLARLGGRHGLGPRARIMETLFDDLLPPTVLNRSRKADFTSAFWCSHARRFVEEWDGEGVDGKLVDVARLRKIWRGEEPAGASGLLLQQAWLAANAREHGPASPGPL